MSRLQLNILIRTIEHDPEVREQFRTAPSAVMDRYSLSPQERNAVVNLDAQELIRLGVNPLLMRSLLVMHGVGNPELYSHTIRLVGAQEDSTPR